MKKLWEQVQRGLLEAEQAAAEDYDPSTLQSVSEALVALAKLQEQYEELERVAVVTDEHALGKEELWCEWWRCPVCHTSNLRCGNLCCPDCGVRLQWVLEA